MNTFASAAVMTGPADPVIEVSVAERLADDGGWPVDCNWRAGVGVAGAVAAAPDDPAASPGPPRNTDIASWVNKSPKELTERSKKHAPLACETVTTFVRLCSHTRYTLEPR